MSFPTSSELSAFLPYLTESERAELDKLLIRGNPTWVPLINPEKPTIRSPQRQAYDSAADILFYGGQAGGGKTDLLIGLALTRHQRSILFRREYKQLHAIVERAAEILGGRAGYNAQDRRWALDEGQRLLRFGACQHPGDERAFQGQPYDFMGFDEITHFLEHQFRWIIAWNRTSDPGQRCRIVCTGNPPTTAEGEWVIRFWGPWLDLDHPRPALPGEIRWFARLPGEDEDVELESGEPFDHKGKLIRPKSRSFIPSSVEDNPFLMATDYQSTLQALPEPLRSQLLEGNFTIGSEDDPWQIIPTDWVRRAQEAWLPDTKRGEMSALGVDIARGGRDQTVLTPRYGAWFAEQAVVPGKATPDGPSAAALIMKHLRDGAAVQIDVIGVGASVFDHLRGNGIRCVPINSAERSTATERSGRLGFVNQRAELWWRMREALDPDYGESLMLPPDRELRADLCAPRWRLTARGIQVEEKDEIIRRLGRSTDKGDSAVYALPSHVKHRSRGDRNLVRTERRYDIHRW